MGAKGYMLKICAAIAFGLFSLNTSAATTGLEFAGGCPASQGKPLCSPGSNMTEENVATLLGVDVSMVTLLDELTSPGDGAGFSVTDATSTSKFGTSGGWVITDSSITHLSFKSDGYNILGEVQATSGTWDNNDVGTDGSFGWNISLVDCPAAICGDLGRLYTVEDFLTIPQGNVADLSNVRAFSVVPVPAAVWLFGSGLLGLVGVARRKRV